MKPITILAFVLLLGVVVGGCKKDSGPSDTGGGGGGGGTTLTEEEKQAIRAGYQAVATSADSIMLTANPLAGLQARLATYQANPNVQTAWIAGQSLFVTFKSGGTLCWNVPTTIVVPPYDGPTGNDFNESCLLKPSERVGNTNALLINAQYGDEGRQYNRDLITYLSQKFQARGYTVTTKNGTDAGVSLFRTGLKQYGAIFYISHGAYDGTYTWQTTGEEGTLDTLMARYPALWRSNQLSIGTVTEKRGGTNKAVKLYMFSQRLIDSNYTANDFPKSMIYLVACQGMKSPTRQVAQSFVNKGARGVIGWDETNCLGQSTGKQLFTTLLCGANIRDAISALPDEAKNDKCAVAAGANLVYYPANADTLRLVDSVRARILFTTPKKDSTYATRNLTLAGSLISGDSIATGIVEVNGVATRMTILSGFRTFSQPIVIDSGANVIHVSLSGKLTDGRCAYVDTTFSVKGNFAALGLWTELRWNTNNTDLDFHLLPPGASFPGSFWTSTDCYYGSRSTSWGGFLDVDDVDGYGPEHITIPTVSDTGTYRLFIHYYSDHTSGTTPTSAFVSAAVRNGATRNFGPYMLVNDAPRGGDIWEVCTIHFPSGTITPVNRLTTLSLRGSPQVNDKRR
jgi:uncharacterized protein YfaP (DUF2135 family)